jgi:hypothetical protein
LGETWKVAAPSSKSIVRHRTDGFIVACMFLLLSVASEPSHAQAPTRPALRMALLAREVVDQAMRDTVGMSFRAGGQPDSALIRRTQQSDVANAAWLRGVVRKYGWPGRAAVGADGASAAFLIAQHATHDPSFQACVLALLEHAVARGDAPGEHYALLFDRVALASGRKQRYGTQATLQNGRMVLQPLEDSVHVDTRRHAMSLPPLAVYMHMLDSMYTTGRAP